MSPPWEFTPKKFTGSFFWGSNIAPFFGEACLVDVFFLERSKCVFNIVFFKDLLDISRWLNRSFCRMVCLTIHQKRGSLGPLAVIWYECVTRPHTIDGRNPAPVEVGSLSHYLQGYTFFRWLALGFVKHQPYNIRYLSFCTTPWSRNAKKSSPSLRTPSMRRRRASC